MAYTSYTSNPDGSYTFADEAGGTLDAFGAPAYQKAREIDMASGAPGAGEQAIADAAAPGQDERTASAGPMSVDGYSWAEPMMSDAGPAAKPEEHATGGSLWHGRAR